MLTCRSLWPMVSRRVLFVRFARFLVLGSGVALSSLSGCTDPEVGSQPKRTKSKAEILEELENPPGRKKAGGKRRG
jgi:hypothetical protein